MKKRYSSIFMLVMVISGFNFTTKKKLRRLFPAVSVFFFFGLFCYSPFFGLRRPYGFTLRVPMSARTAARRVFPQQKHTGSCISR